MARFYADKQTIASKSPFYLDSIQFTNRSVNGVNYQWLLNDTVVSTTANLTYVFNNPGNYAMRLVATNGACTDTSEPFTIPVMDPTPDAVLTLTGVQCYHQDSLKVSVVVCNEGYASLPKGLPITFYNGDPTIPSTKLLGTYFKVPDTLLGKCCNEAYTVVVPAGQTGLNQLFAEVDDSSVLVPLTMPNTPVLESNYGNNGASEAGFQFSLYVNPADTEVARKQSYLLKLSGSDPESFTATWLPGPGYTLSCLACLDPSVQVFNKGMVYVQAVTGNGCTVLDSVPVGILPPDFTITVDGVDCYGKDSVKVSFTVCMNNGYDSVWAGIPVGFDGSTYPSFVTPQLAPTACASYSQVIYFKEVDSLRATVNATDSIPETDYTNNGIAFAFTPFAIAIAPGDTDVPSGSLLPMVAITNGGSPSAVVWSPAQGLSCTGCLEPVLTPMYTQQYQVIVRNQYNCIDTAYALIRTYTGGEVNIPGAFTPNGDGRNDVFFIMGGKDVQTVKHLSIFSRYGSSVFESSDALPNEPSLGWDGTIRGTPAEPGAYVYMALIKFTDGRQQLYKGTLVLIR
jgi:gliding motility-associated-like protein